MTALKKQVILLDIEGTTTSISFVKDKLFPYVKINLKSYLEENWNTDELKSDIKLLIEQAVEDKINKFEGLVLINDQSSDDLQKQSIMDNVFWQMSLDRKTKALKSLQGHIWVSGYNAGQLKGHIYEDVLPNLQKWKKSGIKLYIYSSGSVEAQKLLFGHTIYGNLLEYFSGYFDTSVGPKVESSSYSNILKQINCDADKVLFLTDMLKEAEAASGAGMDTIILARDAPVFSSEFQQVTSFDEVQVEPAGS